MMRRRRPSARDATQAPADQSINASSQALIDALNTPQLEGGRLKLICDRPEARPGAEGIGDARHARCATRATRRSRCRRSRPPCAPPASSSMAARAGTCCRRVRPAISSSPQDSDGRPVDNECWSCRMPRRRRVLKHLLRGRDRAAGSAGARPAEAVAKGHNIPYDRDRAHQPDAPESGWGAQSRQSGGTDQAQESQKSLSGRAFRVDRSQPADHAQGMLTRIASSRRCWKRRSTTSCARRCRRHRQRYLGR